VIDHAHLHPSARSALELGISERKAFVNGKRWYGYPRALEALAVLERLYTQAPSSRTKNLALTGESNNGKTSILNAFLETKGAPFKSHGDLPILSVFSPTEADERRLWTTLLVALGGIFEVREHVESLFQRLVHLLAGRRVRMIMIDEFHDAFHGSSTRQRQLLACIKRLSNVAKIPVVLCGTRVLGGILHLDPQLSNRFPRFDLPTWSLDPAFQTLLETVEAGLPFAKPSGLWSPAMATVIHEWSGGYVGEVMDLVALAANVALDEGADQLRLAHFQGLEWLPPRERLGSV
jgi:chloramphenicol 3-O-phosphotransferase